MPGASSSSWPSARRHTRTASSTRCSRTRSRTSSSTGRAAGGRCRGGSTRGSRCSRRARGGGAPAPSAGGGGWRALGVLSGPRVPLWKLDDLFRGDRREVEHGYALSGTLVHDLLDRYGPAVPRIVLARLAHGDTFDEAM